MALRFHNANLFIGKHGMRVKQRVEYLVGHGESGIGVIVAVDDEKERITVVDEIDGSKWVGLMDHATLCDPDD